MRIEPLLSALSETTVAREAGNAHDTARLSYTPPLNPITSYAAFEELVGDYVVYHHERCVAPGGRLSRDQAIGMGEQMLEQVYRRDGGNRLTAYQDATDGTNGGVRTILDHLANGFKAEAVEHYTRRVFSDHVSPADWYGKVAMVREFLNVHGPLLGPAIDQNCPERYAENYEELVRAYVAGLRRTSSMFRGK